MILIMIIIIMIMVPVKLRDIRFRARLTIVSLPTAEQVSAVFLARES